MNTNLVIGPNEIQATITDFGRLVPYSVQKLDTGYWRLSAALMPATNAAERGGLPWTAIYNPANPATWLGNLTYGNTYTGPTDIQRGTLQIEFAPLPLTQTTNANTFAYSSPG